jgi:hypothetical protein
VKPSSRPFVNRYFDQLHYRFFSAHEESLTPIDGALEMLPEGHENLFALPHVPPA